MQPVVIGRWADAGTVCFYAVAPAAKTREKAESRPRPSNRLGRVGVRLVPVADAAGPAVGLAEGLRYVDPSLRITDSQTVQSVIIFAGIRNVSV